LKEAEAGLSTFAREPLTLQRRNTKRGHDRLRACDSMSPWITLEIAKKSQ
jgi:hypothetical protein